MSSHHVVRENQEPALIVSDFKAIDPEYFGQLLEWSPTIIANDDSIDFLLAEGIKVDIVFTNQETSYSQEQIKSLTIKTAFIPDALDYLVQHQHKAANIIGDYPQKILEAYCGLINIVVLVQGIRYVYVCGKYEKWKEAGAHIFVAENQLKSLVGLKKTALDTFVVEQDGLIGLEFNSDAYVCIGEEI